MQSIKKKDRRLEIISNISYIFDWMHGVDACTVHQVRDTMIKSFKRSERKVEPFICEQLLRNVLQPLGHNQTHTSINLEHFSVSTRTANGTLRNFTVPREDPYNNLDLFFLKDTMFNERLITVNRRETGTTFTYPQRCVVSKTANQTTHQYSSSRPNFTCTYHI